MSRNTLIGILIILAFLIAGGYWLYKSKNNELVVIKQEGGQEKAQEPAEIKWTFTSAGEDSVSGAPLTKVVLRAGEKTYELGIYQGSCSEIKGSSWSLVENEQSGVICWWAGGGTEIGVFEENGKLVVKKGTIEEGTAEGGGFRGDFKAFIEL